MSWVERLIDAIYVEQGLKKPQKEVDSEDERSTANKGKRTAKVVDTPEPGDNEMATQLLLRPHYWARQQFVSRKSQGDVQSRFMKPCFSRISNAPDSLGMQLITPSQDQRSNSFVFMPFIDWELISMQTERKRCLRKLAKEPALRFWPRLPWPIQYPEWRELPIGAKLLIAYSQVEPPIHDRRTLDQAFYYTMNIENAWKRDTDQVLYRYFQTTNEPEEARILMADQLWIWIVDTPQKRDGEPESRLKTVVTAFPPRWSKKEAEDDTEGNEALLENARSVPDAHGRILSALYSDYSRNISSVTDLLCLIIDKCPALFHPLPEEVNDPLDYLDVFATEIGEQASQETDLADSMWEHSEKLQKHLDHKKDLLAQSTRKLFSRDGDRTLLSRVDNDIDKEMGLLSDITQETKCLKVVKDIMDELNGISYIFTQQMNVVRSMVDDAELQQNNVNDGRSHRRGDPDTDDAKSSKKGDVDRPPEEHSKDEESSTKTSDDNPPEGHYEDTPEDMELKYKRLLSTLKKRKETITHLKDEAYRVYRDKIAKTTQLCDLLDLKQKQATVFQAVLASQESREAERQGQTIMLFTIVTVIFVSVERTTHARGFGVQDVPDVIPLTVPLTIVILIISLLLAYSKLIKRLIIFVFGNGVDEQPAEGNDGHGGDGHVLVDLAPAIAARPAAQATAKNA
ncbi:hypothetical protein CEP54_002752 [Fusarium duplospermum]|uniref:Uncharacterized protein n=1 Tax=Fusarium duplospermum TaxID=1325734 RepID=A0A428QTU4_9HYPO|nr:hypothetical protein CEP54_002752 [Fusarium duplospermum]